MSSLEHATVAEAMHPGVITCPTTRLSAPWRG